jgi:hypothetical protein
MIHAQKLTTPTILRDRDESMCRFQRRPSAKVRPGAYPRRSEGMTPTVATHRGRAVEKQEYFRNSRLCQVLDGVTAQCWNPRTPVEIVNAILEGSITYHTRTERVING